MTKKQAAEQNIEDTRIYKILTDDGMPREEKVAALGQEGSAHPAEFWDVKEYVASEFCRVAGEYLDLLDAKQLPPLLKAMFAEMDTAIKTRAAFDTIFAQFIFDQGGTRERKVEAVAEMLSFNAEWPREKNREYNQEHIDQFKLFCDFLRTAKPGAFQAEFTSKWPSETKEEQKCRSDSPAIFNQGMLYINTMLIEACRMAQEKAIHYDEQHVKGLRACEADLTQDHDGLAKNIASASSTKAAPAVRYPSARPQRPGAQP